MARRQFAGEACYLILTWVRTNLSRRDRNEGGQVIHSLECDREKIRRVRAYRFGISPTGPTPHHITTKAAAAIGQAAF
jgi:hypothetical protein